ncbi:WecB/TagA/CpsF family glycosyltransferase [Agrobacterium genomosp. 13]|uniref:N-acetylmannosaminyltransferase, teichoic acid biosynthesis protein n=1 Tax=Agrobacterium genomosp. 13 str. CFBP 6927 TaxID=1183428 RepID=A0ABM9VFZ8_9HYPH|nr:WecB/TagA/CpsF family glycosyltransferase [Agrobacterium genomosp. 13]CUX32971.1 Putative N-acetylmannosaminyltransferase, teichoic acid biosynthesis protein [Agrobacterium genomosp. 13 str. CFBP 6927]
MNFAAGSAQPGSQRNIHGLRVCDLDWNGALELVSGRASACDGHTMLSFLTIEKAKLSSRDIAYRHILESCLLLPQGKAMNSAARAENGRSLPVVIDGVAFTMALLTYMAVPKRIGVAGDDAAQVGEVLTKLRAHAPWHDFVMLNRDMSGVKVDVLLAGMVREDQERWLHHTVSRDDARVAIAVGPLFKVLSSEVAGMPEIFRKLHMSWLYSLCAEPWHIALGKG